MYTTVQHFALKKLLLGFLFVASCIGGIPQGNLSAKLIWSGDYESGNLSEWRTSEIGRQSHSVKIVTSPVRRGARSARFELRNDDPLVTETYRNEVSVGRSGSPRMAEMGQEYWYSFSIFIPANWQNDDLRDELAQFHAPPDPGEVWRNPPLGFDTREGKWEIWNRWDKRRIQTHPNNHQSGHRLLWTGPLHKGQWNDWVVHVKWSYEDDGFLEIWLNDVKVVNDNGPNCYNDQHQRYFKWGIYKRAWSTNSPPFEVHTRVIYNDGMRIGDKDSSYREVAPGSGPPPPSTGDTDHDGLTDKAEATYGTSATRADTDSDGLGDGTEVDFWDEDWDADADRDGRINLLDADADNDGVKDGAEVSQGTDPATPSKSGAVRLFVEAEAGQIVNPPLTIGTDSLASGSKYIWHATSTTGAVLYTFTVPVTGTYVVWGRVIHAGGNSFFAKMDNGADLLWDTTTSRTWAWRRWAIRARRRPCAFR